MPSIRLSSLATRVLPRPFLFFICAVYSFSGLFGRDPWKHEDASNFGVMWTMAYGTLEDWWIPNIAGRLLDENGPLLYILGAGFIRIFSFLDAVSAARLLTALCFCLTCLFVWWSTYLLGVRAEVQPFKYVFGGEPTAKNYGRILADSAVLILLGCFGLAERGHETTAALGQLMFVSILIYGVILSLEKPKQGALCYSVALAGLALSGNALLPLLLLLSLCILVSAQPQLSARYFFLLALPLALILGLSWPLSLYYFAPLASIDSHIFLSGWLAHTVHFSGLDYQRGLSVLKNFPLFSWPVWPFALYSLVHWRRFWRLPHLMIPLLLALPIIVISVLMASQLVLMLCLPALAILAAFGLPTLNRATINAMDWFAVLSFTTLCGFIWLVWYAGVFHIPQQIAINFYRQVPGFLAQFNGFAFTKAVLATLAWGALVYWRVWRHPKVLWRYVMLSSCGTTLMWVLLTSLWMPAVNYARTYRTLAEQLSTYLLGSDDCVTLLNISDAQLASFAYFGKIPFNFKEPQCRWLLRSVGRLSASAYIAPGERLIWEGRRLSDRDEWFQLILRAST